MAPKNQSTRVAHSYNLRSGSHIAKYFHLFPRLPKELQLMIWEEALPGPRVFHPAWWQRTSKPRYRSHMERTHKRISQSPASLQPYLRSLLLACCDSNQTVTKYVKRHERVYGPCCNSELSADYSSDTFFFSFDELKFNRKALQRNICFSRHFQPKVKHIIMNVPRPRFAGYEQIQRLARWLKSFELLETLILTSRSHVEEKDISVTFNKLWHAKLGRKEVIVKVTKLEKALGSFKEDYVPIPAKKPLFD